MSSAEKTIRTFQIQRFPERAVVADAVAVEEPLEIRVAGETLATTLRTPGDDSALALGFLLAEGVIRSARDVGTVAHCGHPGDDGYGNVLDVIPAGGAKLELEKTRSMRRGTLTTAACGVCGRASIDDLVALCGPLISTAKLDASLLAASPDRLRERQSTFTRTGGLHGAAIFSVSGKLLGSAEDIGRHNAVDKVVGQLLREGSLPVDERADFPAWLTVSGRAGFEIVQKAAVAKLLAVVSVSAPSSLAVELAQRGGMALLGFTREGHFNLYSGAERIR